VNTHSLLTHIHSKDETKEEISDHIHKLYCYYDKDNNGFLEDHELDKFIEDLYKYIDPEAYISMQCSGSEDAEECRQEYQAKLKHFTEESLSLIDGDNDHRLTEEELNEKLKGFVEEHIIRDDY